MTAEEWKKVDEALASVWSPCVHLKIDGYKVSLNLLKNRDFKMLLWFISTMNFVASGL